MSAKQLHLPELRYPSGRVVVSYMADARQQEPDGSQMLLDTPAGVYAAWKAKVEASDLYDPERECAVVFAVNTRRRLIGWSLGGIGTIDTILIHPREVFRAAIAINAAAVVLCHNNPSGDPSPSAPDIRCFGDLRKAGSILNLECIDSLVIASRPPIGMVRPWVSLRELGYGNN